VPTQRPASDAHGGEKITAEQWPLPASLTPKDNGEAAVWTAASSE